MFVCLIPLTVMKTVTKKPKTTRTKERAKESKSASPATDARVYCIAALLFAVFVCYANSLTNEFVFDDHSLVFQGRADDAADLWRIATSSYRPLRTLSYAFDFAIWGDKPFGFHLTNLLIHAANTILVFVLLRQFALRNATAFLAAVIFAVHPIQTDAVTYISGRRDVLFTLFYLLAFAAYLKFQKSRAPAYLLAFLVSWGLSLMSKEMAASLPLVIFLWNFCDLHQPEDGDARLKRFGITVKKTLARDKWLYLALAVAAAGYAWYMIFIRLSSGRVSGERISFWGGSLFATVLTSLRIHAWYVKQLFLPTPIAQYLGAFEPSTTLADGRVWLAAVVVCAILTAGVLALRRNRLLAFGIFSFFAFLAPVSQLIPHHELLADHYLYLPMMSFALVISLLAQQVIAAYPGAQKVSYAVLAIALLTLAGLTIQRNREWKNDLTLWQATYQSVPESPRAAYNLGGLLQRSNPERAEQLIKQSVTADPDFEFGYLTLARLYLNQKRLAEAEETARQGLALLDSGRGSFIARNKPQLQSQFTLILSGVEWERANMQKAEALMIEAVQIFPANAEAHLGLASFYRGKDRSKVVETLQRAVAANPQSFPLGARLAEALLEENRLEEAEAALRQLTTLTPNQGDCARAATSFQAMRTAVSKNLGLSRLNQAIQQAEARCPNR